MAPSGWPKEEPQSGDMEGSREALSSLRLAETLTADITDDQPLCKEPQGLKTEPQPAPLPLLSPTGLRSSATRWAHLGPGQEEASRGAPEAQPMGARLAQALCPFTRCASSPPFLCSCVLLSLAGSPRLRFSLVSLCFPEVMPGGENPPRRQLSAGLLCAC